MKNKTTHTDNEFPNLENLKSQNGFETPTDYFDSLHKSIMNEVQEESKVKKISFRKVFAYAASVLVIAGISFMFFFSTPDTMEDYDFESIVLNYEEISVNDYVDEFSEVDLELDENLLFDEIAMN